jgi:hypothetical protein
MLTKPELGMIFGTCPRTKPGVPLKKNLTQNPDSRFLLCVGIGTSTVIFLRTQGSSSK